MPQITLHENTSIKTIHTFHKLLQQAVKEGEDIALNFEKTRRLDLSVIQCLMAAVKSVRGTTISISFMNVPEEVKYQFRITGLVKTDFGEHGKRKKG